MRYPPYPYDRRPPDDGDLPHGPLTRRDTGIEREFHEILQVARLVVVAMIESKMPCPDEVRFNASQWDDFANQDDMPDLRDLVRAIRRYAQVE